MLGDALGVVHESRPAVFANTGKGLIGNSRVKSLIKAFSKLSAVVVVMPADEPGQPIYRMRGETLGTQAAQLLAGRFIAAVRIQVRGFQRSPC
jgi:hypothetical protein